MKRITTTLLKSRWQRTLPLLSLLMFSGLVGCGSKTPEPAYDVPSLLSQKIGDVEKVLGVPTESKVEGPAGYKIWKKNEQTLRADYRTASGRITGFTLEAEEYSEGLKDEEKGQLLALGKLRESEARYTTEYIEHPDRPFRFSGIKVVPQPVNHEVIFRITGSPALTEISYSAIPGTAQPPSTTLVTFPPWEMKFSALDGAALSLSAVPMQAPRGTLLASVKLTAQILVDGKVVQEDTATGGIPSCATEL